MLARRTSIKLAMILPTSSNRSVFYWRIFPITFISFITSFLKISVSLLILTIRLLYAPRSFSMLSDIYLIYWHFFSTMSVCSCIFEESCFCFSSSFVNVSSWIFLNVCSFYCFTNVSIFCENIYSKALRCYVCFSSMASATWTSVFKFSIFWVRLLLIYLNSFLKLDCRDWVVYLKWLISC
jgi:hypothetical protein